MVDLFIGIVRQHIYSEYIILFCICLVQFVSVLYFDIVNCDTVNVLPVSVHGTSQKYEYDSWIDFIEILLTVGLVWVQNLCQNS